MHSACVSKKLVRSIVVFFFVGSLVFSSVKVVESVKCDKDQFPRLNHCHPCSVCTKINNGCRSYCNDEQCDEGQFRRLGACHPCKVCTKPEDECQKYCNEDNKKLIVPETTTPLGKPTLRHCRQRILKQKGMALL
ncbi:uncharacterized protein [Ptychodera flava]|uniref:uncharacterized protein n=1 Tax=Ptychodera flava TaxID=63121 RepID=UPI00396A7C90